MVKPKKDCFIIELKLIVDTWQKDILCKRFEIARKLYNTTLSYAMKQCKLMKESKYYRKQLRCYQKARKANHPKEWKEIAKELDNIRQSFGLSEYQLHAYIKKHQHNYKKHIDSNTSQKIASTVWKAMQDVIFKGTKAHFKPYGMLHSVEGKSNKAGIRFKENRVYWNGLRLPVRFRKNDLFIEESLTLHTIKYCRLIKKVIRGKDTFYLQLIMGGIPPTKRINKTGAFRHAYQKKKRVGIDIGPSTIAIVSEETVSIQQLAPDVPLFEKQKRRLLRKLDRSRRSTNPNNFNTNGTMKRGIKLHWIYSKNYQKTKSLLNELYRKKASYIKKKHGALANSILSLGDEVYIETMQFNGLAKRTKETKINQQGKFQSKKRFGKSIGNHAPALLVEIINQKLKYGKQEIQKVNTITFRASQYNHVTNSYEKKKLHQRWSQIGNHLVQRDLYSAFLLMNSDVNLKQTNQNCCIQTFDTFLKLHNQHIEELQQTKKKYPLSMGIL
ncbi:MULTISPECIES: transposase [unclassified Bacillus cereus group]|uniref:transposase n=1 Tax=unclassified Bacillus cereus group TaxID=2750818 RepID=UPI001F5AD3F5|nr:MULTISPECIES: transposase [unclassified Bacillus cereus group]